MLIIFHWTCSYKDSSYGEFEHIIVFADSMLYENVRPELEQIFDQFVYTPVTEKSFYLDIKPLDLLDNFKQYRNLMFVGLLDGEDNISQYIDKSLSPEIQQAVREGRIFQIFQEDLFAKEQMGIIFSATDLITLKQNLAASAENIYQQMEKYYFERLERSMFFRGEKTVLEDYIANKLGWKIRIQHDYHLVKESDDGNFVWLRRLNPDRSLFIYRFAAKEMDVANSGWLIDLRDSLSTIYYESDSVSKKDTYTVHTEFCDQPALKLIGVWQNHKLFIGGPFRTYAFFDPKQKYIYMIDILVTAPSKRKKPYLDQLEVMANTFQLLPDRQAL
jgi:hypothetical protein